MDSCKGKRIPVKQFKVFLNELKQGLLTYLKIQASSTSYIWCFQFDCVSDFFRLQISKVLLKMQSDSLLGKKNLLFCTDHQIKDQLFDEEENWSNANSSYVWGPTRRKIYWGAPVIFFRLLPVKNVRKKYLGNIL